MPFGSVLYPNLALGQFKSQLAEAGIASAVLNFNLRFARLIGFGPYEVIARFKGVETQVSEWLFTRACWGEELGPGDDAILDLCGEELTTIPRVADRRAFLRQVRDTIVPFFLDHCVAAIAELSPRVVGLSCTFFQTIAALALGRRLREALPEVRLVYGGACFHDEMGDELLRKTPWIDAVATGEADAEIVPLIEALLAGETPRGLPGVRARADDGSIVVGPPPEPASAELLESIPDPNFDEFFREAQAIGLDHDASWRERAFLPFEASRGCWWGQKHHCTFCGLNARGIGYRAKSAARVERSLRVLARRYPVRRMHATDNILATSHIRELLPRLAAAPITTHARVAAGLRLFFEVKANMTRAQIRAMAAAGVGTVQPGIESLSSRHLRLMDKGVTALQNVYFLKCCREYGISALWNILIRLPGEAAEDYAAMVQWIPALLHLQPPSGGAPLVECHRFSPYFVDRGRWLESRSPMPWYRSLFPADRYDLERVAYYFDGTWRDTLGEEAYADLRRLVLGWSERWRRAVRAPRLMVRDRSDGGVEIIDERGGERVSSELAPELASIYRAITDPARLPAIARRVAADRGAAPPDDEIAEALERFVAEGLALRERGLFLGLAIPAEVDAVSQDERRKRLRQIVNQAPVDAPSRRLPVLGT